MINKITSKLEPFNLKLDEEYLKDLNNVINNIKTMLHEENLIRMGFLS